MLQTDLEEKSSDDGLVTQIINDMV